MITLPTQKRRAVVSVAGTAVNEAVGRSAAVHVAGMAYVWIWRCAKNNFLAHQDNTINSIWRVLNFKGASYSKRKKCDDYTIKEVKLERCRFEHTFLRCWNGKFSLRQPSRTGSVLCRTFAFRKDAGWLWNTVIPSISTSGRAWLQSENLPRWDFIQVHLTACTRLLQSEILCMPQAFKQYIFVTCTAVCEHMHSVFVSCREELSFLSVCYLPTVYHSIWAADSCKHGLVWSGIWVTWLGGVSGESILVCAHAWLLSCHVLLNKRFSSTTI